MPESPSTQPNKPFLFVHHGREGEPVEGLFSVDYITFLNPETGYAVVRLVPADAQGGLGVVAVGRFGEVRTGECYHVEGQWHRDPRYGMQVRVSSALRETPRSLEAIERYLAGASIKGLGPHYAKELVAYFGEETFRVLQSGGARLEEVPGIGPVRAQMIRQSWAEHQGIHDLMVNLQGVAGLTPNQAQRIYLQFGQEAWDVVSRDPYVLAEQVRGFGFKTCDRIGRALGIAHDAPQRIQAGVVHLLKEALAEGHLWSEQEAIVAEAAELLQVASEAVAPQVESLVQAERVVREEALNLDPPARALYLPQVAHTEERIAQRLAAYLAMSPIARLRLSPSAAAELLRRCAPRELTDEQRGAVISLLSGARLVILTGGPGTGKTTTARALIACLEALQTSYALCATTGRASKQLAASTERSAATVHRHLRIGVSRELPQPVRESVLVIDEASMIDIWLLDEILDRLGSATHLVLIGDVDQLPSVGPGAVLQDLISAAETLSLPGLRVTRLTQIFRQEAGSQSLIVANCHRVRAGHRPIYPAPDESDYYEMYRETAGEARDLAVSLAAERLPRYLDVPPSEVQVLAPMHGGEAGIRALNDALQQALNPPSPDKIELALERDRAAAEDARVLRVGDKVRQTRNDYQKQVFNGDLGIVTRIDQEAKTFAVRYDEHSVAYGWDELDEIVHAWAMTVHAAQGSQWPAVIIVMLKSHYVMLERNILYTALSRAQRLAVLITQDQAVRIAVAQGRATQRRTRLVPRLGRASQG